MHPADATGPRFRMRMLGCMGRTIRRGVTVSQVTIVGASTTI
jgi:hypothetical protein